MLSFRQTTFTLLILIVLNMSSCIGSGINSDLTFDEQGYFPKMEGIDLEGEERVLPGAFKVPFNLVILAFKREQQKEVNTWIDFYNKKLSKRKDVAFFEIPVIYEVSAPYRFWINNGMRSGIPSDEARQRTITVYTDRDALFDRMSMKEDSIYALVINNKGQILHKVEGIASKENMRTILKSM